MAKGQTVGDLLIKLGVDGIEGVNALKSSLRALGKVAGPTDKNLRKIRTEILEFANAGQQSTQAIRGVIESFKGLQAQASINSGIYKQLAADIEGLEDTLKSLIPDAEKAEQAMERLQTIGFPSKVPDAFDKNIKARRQQLQGLRVDSEEYLDVLVGIKNFEAQQAARVARQEVSAAARVARTGMPSTIVQAEQPATLAALRLRIGEVQTELENLDFTSRDYRDANKELVELQKRLNDALNGTSASFKRLEEAQERATRRAKKLADIQAAQGGAVGTRDPRTGAIIAGGSARVSLAQQPIREISGLYRSIGDIGMAGIGADIDRMGKSVKQVTQDIKAATAASNNSIKSLQAQRTAFQQLQAGIDPTTKDFRDLGKEIDKVDRKLGKLGKKRGINLGAAAQTVGAVASAGIFGGAPGVAGALVGAPFGPAGAAVGAGIGASVGVAAQQISDFTDYAASIRLAEKAMRRLIAAEKDQVESARRNAIATQTIEYAVNKLNVEREDATIGMTRLSAAVLGAGGNIETAALAFLGTTKAIKATKGSADDVRGGLTALVQMFSKGKISAEELSGQLGERFPAAVTAFAEANEISTAALQKQLKQGEVGLDKLVKFLAFAARKYSDGSLEMAASAEESGERQARAFDEVRRELGNQLIDVGSKLQEGIADALADLTPAIVSTARVVARAVELIIDGIVLVVKNLRNLMDVVKVFAGGAVLGALLTMVAKVGAAMGAKGFAFSVSLLARFIRIKLTGAVIGLITQLKALALTMARNPITLLALGITALGVSMFRASQRHKDFVNDITSGAMSVENAGKRLKKYQDRLETLGKIQSIIEKDPTAQAGLAGASVRSSPLSEASAEVQKLVSSLQDAELPVISLATGKAGLKSVIEAQALESARISGIQSAIAGRAPSEQGPDIEALIKAALGADFPTPAGAEGDTAGLAKERVLMSEIELALRRQLRGAIEAENQVLQANLQLALDMTAARQETEDANKRINMEEEAQAKFAATVKRIKKDELEIQAQLQQSLAARKLELGLITQEEFNQLEIQRERARLQELQRGGFISAEGVEEQMNVFKQLINQTPIDKFVKQAKDRLNDLQTVAVNVAQGIGDAVGNALTNGVTSLIEGTRNAKEVFADFLKSVGQILAQEGAKMIATYIAIGVAKAFAGMPGFGKPGSFETGTGLTGFASQPSTAGFDPSGLFGRANGGPVNAGRPYMVGERGPELFVPGSNGGIMRNEEMRRLMGRSPAGAGGGAASMNFTFETTNIGGTEYVSREQLEAAMATTRRQAANDGAKRGMSMTLDKMQNSPRTRSRIGIG